jgi:hypothetical protein
MHPKDGRKKRTREGRRHYAAKLTEQQVRLARELHYDKGVCVFCCAKILGVKRTTMWDAVTYRTWKSIP